MQLFDPNNPGEKKKIIAAAVLGVLAIGFLGYLFLGGGGSRTAISNNASPRSTPTVTKIVKEPTSDVEIDNPANYLPIAYDGHTPAAVVEGSRNIFAYYEPPKPPEKIPVPPTPTPTPVPPLTLTSLSPSSVYARTSDFSLEVMGEKFTPAVHIFLDGRELPTRFVSGQQLGTTVPAAMIASPGTRSVVVHNADGKVYSLPLNLIVTPPPVPNYNYVGIIGKPRFNNDTAVLQKKGDKDLLSVQRGDILDNRFRVSSISEKEVVLIDTALKIRHTIAFTIDTGSNQPIRQPVRTSDEIP
jgi:hypothetical protein